MRTKKPQAEKPVELKHDFFVSNLEEFKEANEALSLTPIEKVMAIELLSHGVEFTMQYKFDLDDGAICHGKEYFLLDFFIIKNWVGLVIECDGKVHNTTENWDYDRTRNCFLVQAGNMVLRFSGTQIYDGMKDFVWPTIKNTLDHIDEIDDTLSLRIDEIKELEKKLEEAQNEQKKAN